MPRRKIHAGNIPRRMPSATHCRAGKMVRGERTMKIRVMNIKRVLPLDADIDLNAGVDAARLDGFVFTCSSLAQDALNRFTPSGFSEFQKGHRIPFDVAGIRTIEIDHTNLESVDSAKAEMKRHMEFTAGNISRIQSPITVALDFALLTHSENPFERNLAELFAGISEIKAILDDTFEYVVDTLGDLHEYLVPEVRKEEPPSGVVVDIMKELKRSLAAKKPKHPSESRPPRHDS
jgi:hypothetical protein